MTKLKYQNNYFIFMDNFHGYLKKQLLDYVEAERKKGIPLEEIEKVLLDAGHKKNIIDEVFLDLEKHGPNKEASSNNPVKNDLVSQLKSAFGKFMAQASDKDIKDAKKDFKETNTSEIVEEVIEEAEIIEEKTLLEGLAFFIYLVFLVGIVLFSAGGSDAEILNVIIGFIPAIISVFISFALLKIADNVPLYMLIPLGISAAFYGVGKFTQFPLFQNLEMEGLSIVNFFIGFIFNVLIVYVRFVKPNNMREKIIKKPKDLPKIIHQPKFERKEKKEIKDLKQEFNI
jgi:hypothetical protein